MQKLYQKTMIGILFFSMTSCGYFFQLENDKNLAKQIEQELLIKNQIVDLAEVTDFQWDSLTVINPYSQITKIEKELGLNLTSIRQNAIEYSDHFNLIVFLKNKKAVKIIELGIIMIPSKTIIKKEKCLFRIGKNGIEISSD